MKNRMRRSLIAVGALGAVAFPLAGMAAADEGSENPTQGYPSTQSPTQAIDAVGSLADTAQYGFVDAADSYLPSNRPDGVNGTETEFPALTPGYVEGPVGGLLKNGPFE
ncbi:hypothetical protein C8E95_4384 [Pseudonocardia autotrophica]|uniref:Uncharacterized protein n=1 Tax=Pseudonocardia autotrophica TaxID=2074 RepID=A0A1Y2MWI0_PSEAH|nr:hypothetical protein [Pseudonocardia autotrophica]OSY39523.1 hypothetical protein BG845_03470 [Pseudonocardia autotrophica]TDN75239.1 hypothetical protein C8E95_4384 [Pseudonocardia autotrophica]BBF99184.1 hypothetical protein Pdca_03940 [Pseudonocardia autotrophica]